MWMACAHEENVLCMAHAVLCSTLVNPKSIEKSNKTKGALLHGCMGRHSLFFLSGAWKAVVCERGCSIDPCFPNRVLCSAKEKDP